MIARYDSINEFLLPSSLFAILLHLPVIDRLDLYPSPLFWLWPTQPCLVLIEGGFRPLGAGELAYGLLYGGAWVALCFALAHRSFRRFVVRREGTR